METLSAKELANQKFDGVKLYNPFGELLGETDLAAIGFIWGESYSGKSTFALGLADAMAQHGRIEYIPAEEHFGITLTKKINQLKAYSEDLHFTIYTGLDQLKKAAEKVNPKVIFLDSISVLSANDQDVVEFAQWCRQKKIGMWMVAHANKDGSYKGNSKIYHEADICIEVLLEDKTATTKKNRILGESRTIQVPFEAKDIKKKSRSKPKKKKASIKKKSKSGSKDFDSSMSEVEQMMKNI